MSREDWPINWDVMDKAKAQQLAYLKSWLEYYERVLPWFDNFPPRLYLHTSNGPVTGGSEVGVCAENHHQDALTAGFKAAWQQMIDKLKEEMKGYEPATT